jgi:hypothetical protein
MKVWISKYALTQGIYEAEVEQSTTSPSMVSQKQENTYDTCYHGEGREWHRTPEEARAKANKMVNDKIKSLEKQLVKLKNMVF